MVSLICVARRTFQLCPLAAVRYSAWVGREAACRPSGGQTERPLRWQIASES